MDDGSIDGSFYVCKEAVDLSDLTCSAGLHVFSGLFEKNSKAAAGESAFSQFQVSECCKME